MVRITETVLRDAHQSLFATRMRTEDMLPILEEMDKIGYASVEMWGGATFDVCLRFLNEDPWERLRQIKAKLKNTPTQMLLRGQNLVGYRHYPDDVVDAFVELSAKNGIDIFRVFDALNDTRNMERAIAAVNRAGAHAQGTICFTRSPVHSQESFIDLGRRLKDLGCKSICVKDMAGLLSPADVLPLIHAMKKDLALPLQVHSHNTAGYAQATYLAAIHAGADVVDCAISPFSNGTAQPPTESMVTALAGTDGDTGYSLEDLAPITEYFRKLRPKYDALIDPISERVDINVIKYQVPGGMLSNLVSQLKKQNQMERFEEVLAEVPRVREEMGWVPLVTPTSQIVGAQATINVLIGERYKMMTREAKDIILGYYGLTPGPVSKELLEKLSAEKEPISVRPADLLEPGLDDIAKQYGALIKTPEDHLSLALYPDVAEKFLKGECIAEELPQPGEPAKASAAATKPSPEKKPDLPEDELRAYDIYVNEQRFHVEVEESESGKSGSGRLPRLAKRKKIKLPEPYRAG